MAAKPSFCQGPYYLRATFPELDEYRLLSPVLIFPGHDQEEEAFCK